MQIDLSDHEAEQDCRPALPEPSGPQCAKADHPNAGFYRKPPPLTGNRSGFPRVASGGHSI